MASVTAECPPALLHLVEPSTTFRLRRRRRFDLEFRSPALKRSAATSAALLHWLRDLSALQRQQLFSLENPWLSTMLRQMFARKLKDGEGKFTVISAQRCDSDQLDDYFTFSSLTCDPAALNYERELEQHIRFCDTSQYLDTVTLAPELLTDFERCLVLAQQVSQRAAFQTPCLVQWDSAAKSWLWQCPPWVLGSAVGLGALALAAFEKNCWARFFEATGRDPRAPGETQGFTWDVFPPDVCIAQLDTLKAFWKSLEPQRRSALIGSPADLNTLFQLSKKTYQELQQKRSDFPLLQSCSYSTNWKLSAGYKEPYYAAIKTRMQRYLSPRSADLISKMMDEEGEYVEFLLLSPLERTLSIFDIVARKTAEKLKEALTAQIADDILKAEECQPAKKQTCKGKKKKKQKRKEPVLAPVLPVQHIIRIDSAALARDLVMEVLNSALLQASQRVQAAEEGFQTVQSGRKRVEKQKSSIEPISSQKTAICHVKQRTVHAFSSPKANAPVVIQWAEPSTDLQTVKFEAEADFPPLSGSTGPATSENLSAEMGRIKAQVLNIMIFRRKTMLSFLYKMQEIVSFLFPGAYVNIFGSYATRLALPTSDLDLAVVNAGFSREETASAVHSLAEVLPVYKWAVHVQPITTASVPVVKLTVDPHFFGGELKDYVKVDISFEDQSEGVEGKHVGLMAVTWVKEMLAEYPFAQELVLCLKQVLYLQGLHSAYLGGLSSYSLVLWVTAYLRTFPCKSSGEALLAILKHYADVDLKTTGVGLHTDSKYYYPRSQPAFTLCETMDPVTPGNNTTKGAYRIADVQLLFRKSYELLQAGLSQGSKDALARLFLELTGS